MATPEFYAGSWEIKTFRSEKDLVVVPVTDKSMILRKSGTPAERLFFTLIWKQKDQPDSELVGLEYTDGSIRGEAYNPQKPDITRSVAIYQTGEGTVEVDMGAWSNSNELVGVWGAEKAGPDDWPSSERAAPVTVET